MDCIDGCRGVVGLDFLKDLSDEFFVEVYECCKDCMVYSELVYSEKRIREIYDKKGKCRFCLEERMINRDGSCERCERTNFELFGKHGGDID